MTQIPRPDKMGADNLLAAPHPPSRNVPPMSTPPAASHLGLLGLLKMFHGLLLAYDPQGTPSLQELWCIGGAACGLYVFDPLLNLPNAQGQLEDFHPSGEIFSNYGIFESLAYTTGWDIKEINFIPRADLLALVSFELQHHRPVLTLGLGRGLLTPALILGTDATQGTPLWQVQYAGEPAPLAFDTAQMAWAQPGAADEEIWRNWCLLVRPGQRPAWAASLPKCRMQLLKWTMSHMTRKREFFHETQLNYATGIAALQTLKRMASAPRSEAHDAYLTLVLDRLHTGWSALAAQLPLWAASVEAAPDLECNDLPALHQALSEAADRYAQAASCLGSSPEQVRFEPAIQLASGIPQALAGALGTIVTPL